MSVRQRGHPPPEYTTPPFPSLPWPPQEASESYRLYYLTDIWRFTLLWTVIIYGLFHLGAAAIALLMQVGRRKSNWKFLWMVPLVYAFVAGVEALMAGSVVGLMSVTSTQTLTLCIAADDIVVSTVSEPPILLANLTCRHGFPLPGGGLMCLS